MLDDDCIDNIIGARIYRNDSEHIPDIPENPVEIDTQENVDQVNSSEQRVDRDTRFNEIDLTLIDELYTQEQNELEAPEFFVSQGGEGIGQSPETPRTLPFTMDEFAEYAKRTKEGDYALDWVDQRDKEKPFYLMLHHKAPHRNWMPDTKHLSLYDGEDLPIPDNFFDTFGDDIIDVKKSHED